jgi:hypothetical protein
MVKMIDGIIIESDEQATRKKIERLNNKFYKFNDKTILNINCIQSVEKRHIAWDNLGLEFDIEEDCIEFTMSNGKSYLACDDAKNNYKRALEKFFPK